MENRQRFCLVSCETTKSYLHARHIADNTARDKTAGRVAPEKNKELLVIRLCGNSGRWPYYKILTTPEANLNESVWHKCHIRIFFIFSFFSLRFPGIVKKKPAAGRRTFSVASHLKTRIHIILHCKTFFQLHTWQFLLQARVVLEHRSTVASSTTSLLPDWITITATSPQWGRLLFKHNYTERLSIPNHSIGIANSFFSTT